MSENKLAITAVVCFIILQGLVMYWTKNAYGTHTIKYDCRLSEISPDFPSQVREQCRKPRAQQ